MNDRENLFFPMFVNLEGKKIVVFGAGAVALRRIRTLQFFHAEIVVLAPEIAEKARPGMETLIQKQIISYRRKCFEETDLAGEIYMVLAATSQPQINEAIVLLCREKGILVNNASDKSQCDFYFPAVALGDGVVAGIAGDGTDHRKVARVAEAVRTYLEGADEKGNTSRKPGE